MVNTNLKNIFRIAFITCLCISISSCKDSLEEFFDDSNSISITSSVSAKETGTLVGGGRAVFSFTLPEEYAANYTKVVYEYSKAGDENTYTYDSKSSSLEEKGYTCTVKNVGYKGYKVNLNTLNLSNFYEYKLVSSYNLVSSGNYITNHEYWNMDILQAGTYHIAFTCCGPSDKESDYSVQLNIPTDLSFYENGGKSFDKIEFTKISEDTSDKFGDKTYAGGIYSGTVKANSTKTLYVNLTSSNMASKEFNTVQYNSADNDYHKYTDSTGKTKYGYYPLFYINGAFYITSSGLGNFTSELECKSMRFDSTGYDNRSKNGSRWKRDYYKTLTTYNGSWDALETDETTTEISFIDFTSSPYYSENSRTKKSFEVKLKNTSSSDESFNIQFIQYLSDDYIKNGGGKISVSITEAAQYEIAKWSGLY